KREILRGRDAKYFKFWEFGDQRFIAADLDFQPEASKIKACRACIATSNEIDFSGEPFHLSFWLEGHYFLPASAASRALSRIIKNTMRGGLVISDTNLNEVGLKAFGLRKIYEVRNPFHGSQRPVSSYVYLKVAESKEVDVIAGLEI